MTDNYFCKQLSSMVQTICVCGAGTMGSSIAQLAAQSGYKTILFDLSEEMLTKSKTAISKNLQALVYKQRLKSEEAVAILNRIIFTRHIKDCTAHLVIEAILEKAQAKIDLIKELAVLNSPETIFATNTSSISIQKIAEATSKPSHVVGMHFFNPATIMKLVEVVKTFQTSSSVVDQVIGVTKAMGKTPVICNDAPGFIVNRIARHYYLEALKLIEQGLADVDTVDEVLQTAGFKMGPFKLMDLIGMDINYSVTNIVWEALGRPERLTPSPVQKAKVEANELGRKTGKGFYNYSNTNK
ncbi:MAG: 3-hydroxybutyryl-CoA dehydrogenase [Segetibacter sp.]|nr:3-hydroxybutyryl-CoA dehydrogenase [Segetibacter sp.]